MKPRILFVDDEIEVLEGLRDLLRRDRGRWELAFAPGAEPALAELDAKPFDVVVSDMRMPGLDGAALLGLVRERRPDAIRVVLSGHSQVDAALRAAPVAHVFLAKPCDPELLRETIERTCGLRLAIADEELRRPAIAAGALPAAESTHRRLAAAFGSGTPGVGELAAIARSDPALAAKLLQLANSSFFGLGRQVTSVGEAVSYLGAATLRSLAEAGALLDDPGTRNGSAGKAEEVREHALLTARISARLVASDEARETAYTAGLLHDVGGLLVPPRRATGGGDARAQEQEREQRDAERAELGAFLLALWGLPARLVDAVAGRPAPGPSPPERLDVPVALRLADALASEIGGAGDGPGAVDATRLGLDAAQLERVRATARAAAGEEPR